MEPFTMTWDFEDEDIECETNFQVGEVEEDSFADCYIECIIRGEFSEPILDEDILFKSFDCLKTGPEQELSRQVLAASSFLERSLGYNIEEARQELSQLTTGENSLHEPPEDTTRIKLLSGERPSTNLPDTKEFSEFTKPVTRKNTENICPQQGCAKKFKNKASLKRHLRTHGPREHVCAECGRAFLEKTKLARHFLVHTGEKPYQCTYKGCGKRFSLDFNLRTHVRIHTQEKRFACTVEGCNKRFVQSGNLKVHVLSHAKTKKDQ